MHSTAAARYLIDPDLELLARAWICLITADFSGEPVTISGTALLSWVRYCANGPFSGQVVASACLVTVLSLCLPSRSSLPLLLLDTRYRAQDTGVTERSDAQAGCAGTYSTLLHPQVHQRTLI